MAVTVDGGESWVGHVEAVRRLRVVVSWSETARDLLAWRIRCETEGRSLEWGREVAKGRAVVSALVRVGLVPEAGFPHLAALLTMPESVADPGSVMLGLAPVLAWRFEQLVPVGADGAPVSRSVSIRAAVGRGLLPFVARILVEDMLARALDAFMVASARLQVSDVLLKHAADAVSTDRVIARAAAVEDKADPVLALANSITALAVARAAVVAARVDVGRNRLRVANIRYARKRRARAVVKVGPDLFDG